MMKKLLMTGIATAMVAGLAIGPGAGAASAAPYWHHRHHRRVVCRIVWRHHHRVRVCRTVWY